MSDISTEASCSRLDQLTRIFFAAVGQCSIYQAFSDIWLNENADESNEKIGET